MNIIKCLLFLTLIGILTACGQSDIVENETVKEEKSPSTTITVDDVDIDLPVTNEFNDKYVEAMNVFADYLKVYKNYKELNNVSIDTVKDKHKEMLLYLNTYEINPVTKLENESYSFIQQMLYHMEQHVNYSLKYLDTNDSVYLDLKNDEYDEILLNVDLASEVLSDYGKYK